MLSWEDSSLKRDQTIVWCLTPLTTNIQLYHGVFCVNYQFCWSIYPDTRQSVMLTRQPWAPKRQANTTILLPFLKTTNGQTEQMHPLVGSMLVEKTSTVKGLTVKMRDIPFETFEVLSIGTIQIKEKKMKWKATIFEEKNPHYPQCFQTSTRQVTGNYCNKSNPFRLLLSNSIIHRLRTYSCKHINFRNFRITYVYSDSCFYIDKVS